MDPRAFHEHFVFMVQFAVFTPLALLWGMQSGAHRAGVTFDGYLRSQAFMRFMRRFFFAALAAWGIPGVAGPFVTRLSVAHAVLHSLRVYGFACMMIAALALFLRAIARERDALTPVAILALVSAAAGFLAAIGVSDIPGMPKNIALDVAGAGAMFLLGFLYARRPFSAPACPASP